MLFNENNEAVKGAINFRTEFSGDPWDIVYLKDKNYIQSLVDIEYQDNGDPWIPPKKQIKKALSFKFVDPKDIKRI